MTSEGWESPPSSVKITVLDDNDNTPTFSQTEYIFNLTRTEKKGYLVGWVNIPNISLLFTFSHSKWILTFLVSLDQPVQIFLSSFSFTFIFCLEFPLTVRFSNFCFFIIWSKDFVACDFYYIFFQVTQKTHCIFLQNHIHFGRFQFLFC